MKYFQEKAKSEHRDKLGERDETIPPDYLKLLESGEQVRKNFPGFYLQQWKFESVWASLSSLKLQDE